MQNIKDLTSIEQLSVANILILRFRQKALTIEVARLTIRPFKKRFMIGKVLILYHSKAKKKVLFSFLTNFG